MQSYDGSDATFNYSPSGVIIDEPSGQSVVLALDGNDNLTQYRPMKPVTFTLSVTTANTALR